RRSQREFAVADRQRQRVGRAAGRGILDIERAALKRVVAVFVQVHKGGSRDLRRRLDVHRNRDVGRGRQGVGRIGQRDRERIVPGEAVIGSVDQVIQGRIEVINRTAKDNRRRTVAPSQERQPA